jgi:AcrR family transcriptional regulator
MRKRTLILEAAARLFEDRGYRGATTRLIAMEAGVSEVTLFRHFGTKEALLREALGSATGRVELTRLPEMPRNVEHELIAWCAACLRELRASRKAIRKSFGEFAERPDVAKRAVAVPVAAARILREYLERASRLRVLPPQFDVTAAATILAGVLFADAVGRDLMPGEFPEPASQAHRVYVRFILGGTTGAARSARMLANPMIAGLARAGGTLRDPATTVFDRRRSGAAGLDALARRGTGRRRPGKD